MSCSPQCRLLKAGTFSRVWTQPGTPRVKLPSPSAHGPNRGRFVQLHSIDQCRILVITRKLRLLSHPQQCGCRQAWGAMRLEEIRIKDVECMSLNNLRMNKSWKLLHTFFILTTSFLSIPEGHSRAMVFRPMATMPQCTRELH